MRKREILEEIELKIKSLCKGFNFKISEEELKERLEDFEIYHLDMIKTSYVDELIISINCYDDYLIKFYVELLRIVNLNGRKVVLGTISQAIYLSNLKDGEQYDN